MSNNSRKQAKDAKYLASLTIEELINNLSGHIFEQPISPSMLLSRKYINELDRRVREGIVKG